MPDAGRSRLAFVADLSVEVGDERGSTTARLTNDDSGLVLDVPDPATLLRCVPGRGLSRDLPFTTPWADLADVPVRLTSQGVDLGRAHLTSAGSLRFRPTVAGIPTLVRTAGSSIPGPWAVVAASVAVVGVVSYVLRHRRAAS